MQVINLNGKWIDASAPVFLASNRAFRYGDGLFETMRMVNNGLVLADYHFERLLSGLSTLEYAIPASFNGPQLSKEIISLAGKNGCGDHARVRLSVFRGNGGLSDPDEQLQYLIECAPLDPATHTINSVGFQIGIYPKATKHCDSFSHLKSANFLSYRMAARYARMNNLQDCLLLNSKGRVADCSIANIFLFKNDILFTPGLAEGCVAGVMRRYLLEKASQAGIAAEETPISLDQLREADEIFLTNAIYGIRWVGGFENASYSNKKTTGIHREFIQTIF